MPTQIRRALIVVDVQNDFLPGGALAVPRGNEIVGHINSLAEDSDAGAFMGLVVFTQDWHPANHRSFGKVSQVPDFSTFSLDGKDQVAWPVHCVQGTCGAEFAANLNLFPRRMSASWQPTLVPTAIWRKGMDPNVDSYSAFADNNGKDTGLAEFLRSQGITHLRVVGLATDYCVAATALDGTKLGFDTTVDLNGCRGISDLYPTIEKLEKHNVEVIGLQRTNSLKPHP
jgi:nicotinamidase/pyrazinamidase